jgi:hypothetical protein
MRSKVCWFVYAAVTFALATGMAFAQGHGHGHNKHDDDDDRGKHIYSDHDREVMRGWYDDRHGDLLPGLAKRDRLPPGLEKQLRVRGTLPPGLRKKIHPCPVELVQRLPPPPPDYEHAIIGGHIVLMNRKTYLVLDIFHFELR